MVLSLFVLIGNPLIVLVIMGVMGYRKRVGFLAGLTVAQISEFSLIFVALGRSLGHVGDSTVGLVTLVGLITIGLSTYLILYSHRVYEWMAPALSVFERARPTRDDRPPPPDEVDLILYGAGRYGTNLTDRLLDAGHSVLVVDWDPRVALAEPRRPRLRTVFGDADDPEFPGSLPLEHTRMVVSTIPDVATSSAAAVGDGGEVRSVSAGSAPEPPSARPRAGALAALGRRHVAEHLLDVHPAPGVGGLATAAARGSTAHAHHRSKYPRGYQEGGTRDVPPRRVA